jgi:amino acid transporter
MSEGIDYAIAVEPPVGVRDERAVTHLRRALGQRDLVLLFVVAVFNLNNVPVVAASGPAAVWMWGIGLLLFFLPQGVAVIELSRLCPHEGGVYLWTKEIFGDFHGFLSGWCYWTNNIFYIPSLVLYLVGISVFIGPHSVYGLGDNRTYVSIVAVLVLWIMTGINILGVNVGKWVNNLGGAGSVIASAVLVALAAAVWRLHGSSLQVSDFRISTFNWGFAGVFAVVLNSLVGLELASVMGDEIREPLRILPRAVVWGGVITGALYIAATLAVNVAMPAKEIGAVQGILQAVGQMAHTVGIEWLLPPFAILFSLSLAGTTSAWLACSARIPFVAGLDNFLPPALGRLHPRFATPYVALIVQGTASCAALAMSFVGSTVQEGYRVLLLLAVVLQLIPFLYIFAALLRLASRRGFVRGRYSRTTLLAAGATGIIATAFGIILAFVPPMGGDSAMVFEAKMIIGTLFFLGLGASFFLGSARRRAALIGQVSLAAGK